MITFKINGIDNVLNLLRALPVEVTAKNGGPVRKALRKGAVVIQKAEIANLQAVTSNATKEDIRLSTGLLMKNVVVTRGKAPADGKGERMLVRVKRKTYQRAAERNAQGKKAKRAAAVTTLQTAQLLEYGSSKQTPEPWIRPAFENKAQTAIVTVVSSLVADLERLAAKYLKGP